MNTIFEYTCWTLFTLAVVFLLIDAGVKLHTRRQRLKLPQWTVYRVNSDGSLHMLDVMHAVNKHNAIDQYSESRGYNNYRDYSRACLPPSSRLTAVPHKEFPKMAVKPKYDMCPHGFNVNVAARICWQCAYRNEAVEGR